MGRETEWRENSWVSFWGNAAFIRVLPGFDLASWSFRRNSAPQFFSFLRSDLFPSVLLCTIKSTNQGPQQDIDGNPELVLLIPNSGELSPCLGTLSRLTHQGFWPPDLALFPLTVYPIF